MARELRDEEIARREQRSRVAHRERDLATRRAASRKKRRHRTWSNMLESLANPLESLRVRLQAASRSVAERASELGVLLVKYSKPGSAHDSQQMVSLPTLKKWELMFWWRPTRDELNEWVWYNLKAFAERENRSPKLNTEAWL